MAEFFWFWNVLQLYLSDTLGGDRKILERLVSVILMSCKSVLFYEGMRACLKILVSVDGFFFLSYFNVNNFYMIYWLLANTLKINLSWCVFFIRQRIMSKYEFLLDCLLAMCSNHYESRHVHLSWTSLVACLNLMLYLFTNSRLQLSVALFFSKTYIT